MSPDLKELKETLEYWNRYARMEDKSSSLYGAGIFGLILAGFVYYYLSKLSTPEFRWIGLILPGISILLFLTAFLYQRKTNRLKKELNELGWDRVNKVEEIIREIENQISEDSKKVFSYFYFKGFGKQRQTFTFYVHARDDFIVVYKRNNRELILTDWDGFKIIKGDKALFREHFKAEVSLEGNTRGVLIRPADYDKYMGCLEEYFDKAGK